MAEVDRSVLRLLLSAHYFQTSIHVPVGLTIFLFTAISENFLFPLKKFLGILSPFILKTNAKMFSLVIG